MEKPRRSQKVSPSWGDVKVVLIFLLSLGLFCGAGWAFLNKGLYLLPEKMCEGVLERDMVKQVLPRARSADSGSGDQGAGYDLIFSCHVTTSNDSILSGRALVQPISREKWREYYRGSGERNQIIRVSVGDMEALAQIGSGAGTSSVYIPCTPPGAPPHSASQPYAVVGETWVHGEAKPSGAPLRQSLTDIAYRLTEHAYKLAECKAPRVWPKELPRYEERG
ncbi:hypothetical protein ACF061_14600 [Streptomyces sp. NPDC015220]|uniref:hypothetical protein n=1 Tax=Streptomyces sp. NPDC015220 TaxID=3364947 RepID=UPI00370328BB